MGPVAVAARSNAWVSGRSFPGIVGSNSTVDMGVSLFECCALLFVLSGRGLCEGLITLSGESYRLWCVVGCDLETPWMRRPWPTGGGFCCAKRKKNVWIVLICCWPCILVMINFRFQLNAQYFISIVMFLYMFRAPLCPSSGGPLYIYNIWFYVSLKLIHKI